MRTPSIYIFIALFASAAWAQDTNDVAKSDARDLLSKVLETYASANVISDSLTMTYVAPTGSESVDMELLIESTGSSRYEGQGTIMTAADGQLYIQAKALPHKYFRTEIKSDVPTTIADLFQSGSVPFHYQAIDGMTVDQLIQSLTVAGMQNLSMSDVRKTTTDNGETLRTVVLIGKNDATMKIHVDPKAHLIERTEATFRPQSNARGMPLIKIAIDYNPVLMDALPEPIAFDTTGKREVDSLAKLTLAEGDPAPAFTLESSKGGTVSLKDLRGKVVVLDFWATWCGPCKMALPNLEKFHQWTERNDRPIEVFAVNGGQRERTAETRNEAALNYWRSQEFTMPTLLDPHSEAFNAYVSQGIPLTVIIDPRGNIAAMHIGFDPNMFETLKKETTEALESFSTTG